jgi:capsular polysaccharide biosynthesis protein
MPDVETVLHRHRFETVDLDRLSVRDQIELVQSAAVVVAIHGAGLSNLVFRYGEPTVVVEIFPPHDADASFYLICKDLGYEWFPLLGHSPTNKTRLANFALDVDALDAALRSFA